MKEEKLQSLLYCFIENRERDTVDGIHNGTRNISVECDEPVFFEAQGDKESLSSGWISSRSEIPPSLLNFFPFNPLTPDQSNAASAVGRNLAQLAEEYSSGNPDSSLIKFEKSCMIVAPEEQVISIPVIRSDNIKNVAKFTWKTCDKTALSGTHYVASSGEIVFGEGEWKKTIEIQILTSADKAIDLRFEVKLDDISGMFNPKPMTVTLKKTECFYADERNVINDLQESRSLSVDTVGFILNGSLTRRTFHIALSHLCSIAADSVPVQLALAFELSRLCIPKLRGDVLPILFDFFRMDDIDY